MKRRDRKHTLRMKGKYDDSLVVKVSKLPPVTQVYSPWEEKEPKTPLGTSASEQVKRFCFIGKSCCNWCKLRVNVIHVEGKYDSCKQKKKKKKKGK